MNYILGPQRPKIGYKLDWIPTLHECWIRCPYICMSTDFCLVKMKTGFVTPGPCTRLSTDYLLLTLTTK